MKQSPLHPLLLSAVADSLRRPFPEIRLLPDGAFAARDGRPGTLTGGNLNACHNGQPAPAAGWIESLRYEPGQGLFASIRWTEGAKAFIEQDEYRFISPVFSFNPQNGDVLELKGAALTNVPALDGLGAVAATEDFPPSDTPQPETAMNALNRLKQLLGLPEDAAEETLHDQLSVALSVTQGDRVARSVETAVTDGRLSRGLVGWATALGRQNPEALETYLAAVSPIAALSSFQSTGSRPALSAPAASPLSDEERFVCAQLGLSEAEYLAVRG